jgi:7-carboxy-7-deazaguanine synthase
MKWVEYYQCRNVTITGGEPLAQRNGLNRLLRELRVKEHNISIETNGSYAIIDAFPTRYISWVVDYKLPSSGESQFMSLIKPWHQLTENDYIKFVITDRKDYDIALVEVQKFWEEGVKAQMIFSPIIGKLDVNVLRKWMAENGLFSIPMNLQLHKLARLIEEK